MNLNLNMQVGRILETLRELPGILKGAPEKGTLPFSMVEGGIPKGAVTEISGMPGSGKTEAMLRFLAENPKARIAWIEDQFTVYPSAFPQSQVGLDRVLFIDTGQGATAGGASRPSQERTLWAVRQILQSQIFGIVVLASDSLYEVTELRRLQLAAEKSGASLVILNESPSPSKCWPISLQLHSRRSTVTGQPILTSLRSRTTKLPERRATVQELVPPVSKAIPRAEAIAHAG